MATSHTGENATQGKTCKCGEGDPNVRATRTSDNPDKRLPKCSICQVYKSGPLFISSKGIGWTSWKKRWFILTRTSLVFYRSDPNATPQKGSEPNLTLGGIDLNSSGSIVVKADKKLLTVLFPDGRDGRTFTLKAETPEDLYEWKIALENAVAQAPSAALALGQNGIFSNDIADSIEASFEQWRDRRPVKSSVLGRPILLSLEDIDGSPSFLEKALTFIEEHGIKVEGILRQSADVEEVERRVQEYEQGKNEFSPNEDAHVIGDCIKHVIRELPSSPVPASCCTALVEAYRTDRGSRINAMHAAITETFPEPNRRLVQRILKMMRTVASHKSVNRMTLSALAACMAPLLLRPLLAGDCELEDDFNMGGDGSIQLLQAAAAANHAQAIVIILLEEYEKIFDDDLLEEDSLSSELYSESEDGDVENEDLTDNDILEDGYHDADNGLEADVDDDPDCSSSGTLGDSNSDDGSDLFDHKVSEEHSTGSSSPLNNKHPRVKKDGLSKSENRFFVESSHESLGCISSCRTFRGSMVKSVDHTSSSNITKCVGKSNEPLPSIKRPTVWGRTSARKNLSMESIDYSSEDEIAVQRLEMTKTDLQTKITKEAEGNAILQASLEKRKEALHERRLALEQDVERLREQLQKERDLRSSLEDGLMNLRPGHLLITSTLDGKTRADLEEVALAEADIVNLKQKVTDLRGQLTNQLHYGYDSLCQSCSRHLYEMQQSTEIVQQTSADNASLLHQNENASDDENVLSEVDLGNVHKQKHDLPPPNNTMSSGFNDPATISFSKKSSAKDQNAAFLNVDFPSEQNAAFLADHEDINTQTPESPSPETQPPMKQHQKVTDLSSTISLDPTNDSHSKEPSIIVCNAGSKKHTSRDENLTQGTECGNAKTRAQGSPYSPDKKPPQKFQSNTANWSGKEFLGPNSASSIEPTHSTSSAEDPTTIFHGDTASKNSALSDDNSKFRREYGTSKSEAQDSQCSTKSLGSAEETTFGCISASKKFSLRGDTVKKETQDPASQMQQLSSVNLNSLKSIGSRSEEMATINHNAASKKFTSGNSSISIISTNQTDKPAQFFEGTSGTARK